MSGIAYIQQDDNSKGMYLSNFTNIWYILADYRDDKKKFSCKLPIIDKYFVCQPDDSELSKIGAYGDFNLNTRESNLFKDELLILLQNIRKEDYSELAYYELYELHLKLISLFHYDPTAMIRYTGD